MVKTSVETFLNFILGQKDLNQWKNSKFSYWSTYVFHNCFQTILEHKHKSSDSHRFHYSDTQGNRSLEKKKNRKNTTTRYGKH